MTVTLEHPPAFHNVFVRGAGQLSDGYVYGVIGAVITLLARRHPEGQFGIQYDSQLVVSIVFAGTVARMLLFGWLAYTTCRKFRWPSAAIYVMFYSAMSGFVASGSLSNLEIVHQLCFTRFSTGMALGSDHPRGSFCASEQMEQERIAKSARHGWLVLGTNTMFDVGFVIAAFVPLLLYWIHGEAHLSTIWGLSLFLGAVPGFFHVFYSAIEPPHCCDANRSVKAAYVPLWLSLKWNWRSFLGLSVAWFIYDFIMYPLGIYASAIINDVTGGNSPLSIVFGWTMVINLLYIPGTMAGVFLIDSVSPRTVMVIGSLLQAAVGFIVAALLSPLTSHVAVIAVAYGTFLSLGEVGPGNCLIVLAAKTGPTATRGQICDLAFGIGKVGAFIGIWVIPRIIDTFGGLKSAKGITGPFWIGGALAALSALVTILLVKPLAQDGARAEDEAFHQYLKDNGFDASHLGVPDNESSAA